MSSENHLRMGLVLDLAGNTVIALDKDKVVACDQCKVFKDNHDAVAAHEKECTGGAASGFDADGRALRREGLWPIHAAHELHEIDAPLHQFDGGSLQASCGHRPLFLFSFSKLEQ